MANDAEALARIKNAARYGDIIPSRHARERMDERHAQAHDVKNAIVTATSADPQPDDLYELSGGKDIDGHALNLVVKEVRRGVFVVTLFDERHTP